MAVNFDNFHMKICCIVLIFAQNVDKGTLYKCPKSIF